MVASHRRQCVNLTSLEINPQTSHTDSMRLATELAHRPVGSVVVKSMLSVREVWGSIPGPVQLAQRRQWLVTVATFLRSCIAQVLSRRDGLRHSLLASR